LFVHDRFLTETEKRKEKWKMEMKKKPKPATLHSPFLNGLTKTSGSRGMVESAYKVYET